MFDFSEESIYVSLTFSVFWIWFFFVKISWAELTGNELFVGNWKINKLTHTHVRLKTVWVKKCVGCSVHIRAFDFSMKTTNDDCYDKSRLFVIHPNLP